MTKGLPGSAVVLRRRLAAWFRVSRRDLPWRRVRDPYAIWIAEVMLQQTTVLAATPYWRRFVSALPDLTALSRASIERVLALWSGLGYYQRARNLHRAARQLTAGGKSTLPATVEEMRRLPGVGAYTSAAVASIAFGAREAAVDGNVRRVLTRLAGIDSDPRSAGTARCLEALARELLDPAAPGDFNQALMDLGATICTPRRPSCDRCPWAASCVAHRTGEPERFPRRATRPPMVDVLRGVVRVADRRGRLLLRRVPPGAPNAGLWELPAVDLPRRQRPGGARARWSAGLSRRLTRVLSEDSRLKVRLGEVVGRTRHTIMHRRMTVFLVNAELLNPPPAGPGWRWVQAGRLGAHALTGETRKLLVRDAPTPGAARV